MEAYLSAPSRPSVTLSEFSGRRVCQTKRNDSLLGARGRFAPGTWERVVLGRRGGSRTVSRLPQVRATATAGVSLVKPKQTGNAFADLCINSIRFLAVDAVEKANSGHPGAPMGQAPLAFTLWDKYLRFNPKNPNWVNRDRFVLSCGHGSMLQYALLYLYGYDQPTMDDIKTFCEFGSCATSHPENFLLPGVEVTTGPLGSGVAQAVGLAIAEAHLGAMFNTPEEKLIDHYTYFIMSDGCMQEGVAAEAASLAGHLGLGKLIGFFDDNKITYDGPTDLAFSEDVVSRFKSYNWQVISIADGNTDIDNISKAIEEAQKDLTRPSLIIVPTTIGFGSPKHANKRTAHGEPFGSDEVKATRENLGWKYAPFEVPEEVLKHCRRKIQEGARLEQEWNELLQRYKSKHPEQAALFERMVIRKEKSPGWEKALKDCAAKTGSMATRQVSGAMLNALAAVMPEIIGGSADLAPSNNTLLKGFGDFSRNNYKAKNMRFGVREAAMTAITAGIKLHNTGLFPYCATFLIFTDYARGMLRLAALSEAGITFITTHDSVALGEDGPTHQPIEHLASLRAMPNVYTFRPCDANECAAGYALSIRHDDKVVLLALTRQKTNKLETSSYDGALRGAYVVSDNSPAGKHPDVILIGTGSEVDVVVEAADQLRTSDALNVRVVSMPCMELFEDQDAAYQESVLPAAVPRSRRVVCEAASSFGWSKYADHFVCIDRFGASGKGPDLMKYFGITPSNVAKKAREAAGKGV
ncbi:transketolase [Cyanidioschyzon merolae strain 10D]|uniref:transketolase n=1 Tax=Cyanidioschyzon merolae (strain NIES-3377 / 10D) TaxID=280699 RepID=M1VJI5_CYAM1|nr:transketolase [Cyanidioschyzon merolae strain 10D]BAM81493.1 transketolase [Cyanidioschyzon merolae strain 10D]|eukprot:XP_005537529.1 transketolase [Cyanidioschyzon merolae strain 10D]